MNRSTQASLSITNSRSSLRLMSIESVMPSSHLILCRPLLLLPPIPPSIRVFPSESALHMRWPKYWSFSLSIRPSSEHSGLISFRMDWLDLLAVQGTLKSLLQHHSSKASILRHSGFFIVQLSHPYMATGKTIALTRRISCLLRREESHCAVPLGVVAFDIAESCPLWSADRSFYKKQNSALSQSGLTLCWSDRRPPQVVVSLLSFSRLICCRSMSSSVKPWVSTAWDLPT